LLVHHYYDHYGHRADDGAEKKGYEECRYGKAIHFFGGLGPVVNYFEGCT
jgi:hypothetical protein